MGLFILFVLVGGLDVWLLVVIDGCGLGWLPDFYCVALSVVVWGCVLFGGFCTLTDEI